MDRILENDTALSRHGPIRPIAFKLDDIAYGVATGNRCCYAAKCQGREDHPADRKTFEHQFLDIGLP